VSWYQRYRVRHYLGHSIWVFPTLGTVAAIGAVRLLHLVERDLEWVSPVHPDTARAVLGTMASALFTSLVFVCSALLVAFQLASAQLTPRIIGVIFRDPVTKFAMTLFAFMFTFSLAALLRVTSSVPLLTAHVAAYGCLASVPVFFYLIDHLGKVLRPSGALRAVAGIGRYVINDVYPQRLAAAPGALLPDTVQLPKGEPVATVFSNEDGVVQAFDQKGLLSLAQQSDCVIEMVPQVGDHVAQSDLLFRLYGGGTKLSARALCQCIALGQERTLEQDPTFAFRIMVDVASKGLSPAINDPTTAVLALDQINHLLRMVGERQLDDGRVSDPKGHLRLLYRTPDWEDFVYLAVTEIRHFGCNSIQVARRLHAMLERLIRDLPTVRAPLLRQELALVRRSAERFFVDPEDQALAGVGDFQGVGGKTVEENHGG
jgi:uncharacterized membrane protein